MREESCKKFLHFGWWCYGVVTIGELCLSPMGLSIVSKLSPTRITALMMGGFFGNQSETNFSGILASTCIIMKNKEYYFLVNFGLLIFCNYFRFKYAKRLNAIKKKKEFNLIIMINRSFYWFFLWYKNVVVFLKKKLYLLRLIKINN